MPITTKVSCEVESCLYLKVYLIQHYVIKCVNDLCKVSGFLRILWFPPPIKLTEIRWKLELNNHKTNLTYTQMTFHSHINYIYTDFYTPSDKYRIKVETDIITSNSVSLLGQTDNVCWDLKQWCYCFY